MPKCQSSLESPLEAQTFTGPTETEITCDIGTRLDIKHWVSLKNLRNFPVDVTSFSLIRSEPRLIRFELGDPTGAEAEIELSEHTWTAVCVLDTDETKTFGVRLMSTQPHGTQQDIEVKLAINRWHEGYNHEQKFPLITVSS